MQVHWYLYRFDSARYFDMRPRIRAASTPQAILALDEGPEVEAIADALADGEMTLAEAHATLIQQHCCVGEPLPFTLELPRLTSRLERTPGMEEAAALLGAMLSGKHLESWLSPTAGLSGFLTSEEVEAVHTAFRRISPRALKRRPGRRRRQGGLFRNTAAWCVDFVRHLCGRPPRAEEILQLLVALLEEAARDGKGIAAVVA